MVFTIIKLFISVKEMEVLFTVLKDISLQLNEVLLQCCKSLSVLDTA